MNKEINDLIEKIKDKNRDFKNGYKREIEAQEELRSLERANNDLRESIRQDEAVLMALIKGEKVDEPN
ncbi:hypothetical protein ACOJIU_11935 [Carnobacterium maltaromaticum]|uniref:hypothetical protein n=1 Tax=Carnobacterium maltaromaticum TaxID=2751 RepID=UPI0012FBB4F0|nr:hypothetical protein [Carnobacterium maltaromaticum]